MPFPKGVDLEEDPLVLRCSSDDAGDVGLGGQPDCGGTSGIAKIGSGQVERQRVVTAIPENVMPRFAGDI
ncbi:hypothetical protein [Henriciella sp.]|uniref:hypothetical protein n=1 Tax=Henriciella sp. TaxID=1968823 RepID=UPI000C0EC84E|nr:hypothetical protein [Henriciella sp.]PHR68914.1 MAG: hypothetical protein COA64_16755 [Henriciella sp.]